MKPLLRNAFRNTNVKEFSWHPTGPVRVRGLIEVKRVTTITTEGQ